MKNKLKFISIFASIIFITFAFKPESSIDSKNQNHRIIEDLPTGKIKFVIRWSGMIPGTDGLKCDCPKCKCPGCPCPLGICGCSSVAEASENVDMGSDVGTATVWFDSNHKLNIKFDQQTAVNIPSINTNNVVPVSGNTYFSSTICNILGYNSIMIPNGFYQVDYTNSTYGTIIINAITS